MAKACAFRPIRMVRGGEICDDVMKLILANVRSNQERRARFRGADRFAKNRRDASAGNRRAPRCKGSPRLRVTFDLLFGAADAPRDRGDSRRSYEAEDALDDDGIAPAKFRFACASPSKAIAREVDFTGSSPQVAGALNAVEAITVSAVSYVFAV